MRPQLLKISREPGQSFSLRRDLTPSLNDQWHFHAEAELIHFKKGQGTQFVGDGMRRFRAGDVVLVGANLPHCWRFDDVYLKENTDVHVAHFSENFFGDTFLHLPETTHLRTVLDKAKRGLQVEGEARKRVAGLLEKMLNADGMHRLLLLIEALYAIAVSSPTQELSSVGFQHTFQEAAYERINTIYAYSLKHFRRPILLEEIAAVANISPNSFCRFFKSRTRKTYSRFLIEVRVGHACKLLIENNLSIKQLCYESGFSNFTGFYKYFKLITGKSPLGYQREFSNFNLKKSYV
jgi:AraC-like DNA-binding protein